jgi:hypothetical protein
MIGLRPIPLSQLWFTKIAECEAEAEAEASLESNTSLVAKDTLIVAKRTFSMCYV